MDRSILSLILLLIFSMINSKLIPTNDLKLALSEAEPGDIIELKSGIYRDAPYSLKSGSQGKPIIIRSATYADIVFSGNQNSCIFNGERTSIYIHRRSNDIQKCTLWNRNFEWL